MGGFHRLNGGKRPLLVIPTPPANGCLITKGGHPEVEAYESSPSEVTPPLSLGRLARERRISVGLERLITDLASRRRCRPRATRE